MNAEEYYLKEYGLSIGLLPLNVSNVIASSWIEHLITPKEEILRRFKEFNIPLPEDSLEQRKVMDEQLNEGHTKK